MQKRGQSQMIRGLISPALNCLLDLLFAENRLSVTLKLVEIQTDADQHGAGIDRWCIDHRLHHWGGGRVVRPLENEVFTGKLLEVRHAFDAQDGRRQRTQPVEQAHAGDDRRQVNLAGDEPVGQCVLVRVFMIVVVPMILAVTVGVLMCTVTFAGMVMLWGQRGRRGHTSAFHQGAEQMGERLGIGEFRLGIGPFQIAAHFLGARRASGASWWLSTKWLAVSVCIRSSSQCQARRCQRLASTTVTCSNGSKRSRSFARSERFSIRL